jgi:hypothetical protein
LEFQQDPRGGSGGGFSIDEFFKEMQAMFNGPGGVNHFRNMHSGLSGRGIKGQGLNDAEWAYVLHNIMCSNAISKIVYTKMDNGGVLFRGLLFGSGISWYIEDGWDALVIMVNWLASSGGGNYLVNPTGLGIRSDDGGDGHWGAQRGNRTHRGIDFSTIDGQNIVSPIDGRVRNFKGSSTGYPMIQIYPSSTNVGFDYIEILYAGEPYGVKPWTFRNVSAGEIIGISLNLQGLGYPSNVGSHIHLQMWHNGTRINPTPFFFGP